MPLTATGKKVLARMRKKYGAKKGKQVMYASINKNKPGSAAWHTYKKKKGKIVIKKKK